MSKSSGESFWAFSLAVYGRAGVAEACLRLQDRHGVDVNLLLFACWVGASGAGRPGDDVWRKLISETHAWRAGIVEPLRGVRRRLKAASWPGIGPDAAAAFREEVKRLELEAERAQQSAISVLCPVTADPSIALDRRGADAADNVARYVALLGVSPAERDRADMDLVVAAAVAGCDKM